MYDWLTRWFSMKALVVYDSMYGNTEAIANTIGSTLHAEVVRVDEVKPEQVSDLDLLIVGSPTQAFRPLKRVQSFLQALPSQSLKGKKVADFDTRSDVTRIDNRLLSFMVKTFGYAAKPIVDALTAKGGIQILPPEGFLVDDKEGPLKDGERERAARWAKALEEAL